MNILVEDGKVAAWLKASDGAPEGCEVIDAGGLLVAPGFIDMHVHLREPGHEHKESIASGCAAAVAGGWTSVCPMPNTNPVNDNAAITRYMIEQAEKTGLANVFPIGAITKSSDGSELAEMGEMKAAGAVAVSDDGDKVVGSAGLYLKGLPALAEEIDVVRDILLARDTGAHVHIAHISTAGAVEAVRRAKNEGLSVTCEAAPHHFTLTDSAVEGYDTNTKMAPPLRSEEDRQAILAGLSAGTIDAIATDHAPHHADEKSLEYDRAPFGIVGLETAVGLAFTELVHKGVIDLVRLVELCSTNPARILSVTGRGTLTPGSVADITILDPEEVWTFKVADSRSKSKNSPFDGREFRGRAVMTIVNGRVVFNVN